MMALFHSMTTHISVLSYDYTRQYCSLNSTMYPVDHLILTLLCQHYAGITESLMPKAMPAYCACP